MPISLSLPLDGKWARKAPGRFLENLLPDNPTAREAMMRASGAAGTDSFDLLDGADSSGGLVFSLHDDYPAPRSQMVSFASDDDIASAFLPRARPLCRGGSMTPMRVSLWPATSPNSRSRESATDGRGPTRRYPRRISSNHPNRARRMPISLRPPLEPTGQAVRFGILKAGVMEFAGERTYVIERFDRRPLENGESGPVAYGGFPSIPWPAPGTEIHGEGEGRAAHASPGRSGRRALLFMDSPARFERVRRER